MGEFLSIAFVVALFWAMIPHSLAQDSPVPQGGFQGELRPKLEPKLEKLESLIRVDVKTPTPEQVHPTPSYVTEPDHSLWQRVKSFYCRWVGDRVIEKGLEEMVGLKEPGWQTFLLAGVGKVGNWWVCEGPRTQNQAAAMFKAWADYTEMRNRKADAARFAETPMGQQAARALAELNASGFLHGVHESVPVSTCALFSDVDAPWRYTFTPQLPPTESELKCAAARDSARAARATNKLIIEAARRLCAPTIAPSACVSLELEGGDAPRQEKQAPQE